MRSECEKESDMFDFIFLRRDSLSAFCLHLSWDAFEVYLVSVCEARGEQERDKKK
jgi:hypothetical protein